MLKIYVNTWANYNENGANGGEWIELPMTTFELECRLDALAEKLGEDDAEFAIHDYEWSGHRFGRIDENQDISELNDCVCELDDLDEYDQRKLLSILEAVGGKWMEAINDLDDYGFYDGCDMDDVARELVLDYIDKDTPEIFKQYFDYEAFARDLQLEGNYTECYYGVLEFR